MVFVCLSYTCGTIIMEKFSKSVLNSFFFASLCPCIAIIRRIVPENSNNRSNCVLSLHAHTYYMPSDTNQRWSLVPLVEHFLLVCLDLHQELLSFYDIFIATTLLVMHHVSHRLRTFWVSFSNLFGLRFVSKYLTTNYMANVKEKRSTIVLSVCCWRVCVCILSARLKIKWVNEWMNACKTDKETERKWMNPLKYYTQTKIANDSWLYGRYTCYSDRFFFCTTINAYVVYH